jgi:hypothetical protein
VTTSFEKAPILYVTAERLQKHKLSNEFVEARDYPARLGYIPIEGEVGMLATKAKFTGSIKGIRLRLVLK